MRLKTLPILLAFLLMGVADAMGPLSGAVQKNYQLSSVMATLTSFFVFIAFAIFSVPGGWLAARIGKKKLLLLGLALATAAVAVPAFTNPGYGVLLVCIFLLGVGTTFLQVAGNPIMRDVSAPGDYSRNLALAQGIKGVGSSVSSYLVTAVTALALFAGMGWRGAFPIFFALMALALVSVAMLKVDETKADAPPGIGKSLALLGEPVFALAVLGIFLYVGAEVCMGRFLQPTLAGYGIADSQAALLGPTLFFGTLTFGRLVAGSVKVSPRVFFRLSAFLGLAGMVLILLPLVLGIVLVVRMICHGSPDVGAILAIIGLGLGIFLVAILFAIIRKFLVDFIVPLMFLRQFGCLAAWREFAGLVSVHFWSFVLYLLFQILLTMAISIVVMAVALATCCCCCFLLVPYLGTVLLLPVIVFQRSYSLYFLAQLGADFDVFAAPAMPPTP